MFPADIVHRAARLFFAVSCAVAVGWTAARLIGTDHPDAFRQAKSATAGPPASCDSLMSRRSDCLTWLMLRASWSFVHDEYASEPLLGASPAAGITCAVLQAPVIGHLARAGVENFVGTMLGGWLGFAIFVLGHAIQVNIHKCHGSARSKSSSKEPEGIWCPSLYTYMADPVKL